MPDYPNLGGHLRVGFVEFHFSKSRETAKKQLKEHCQGNKKLTRPLKSFAGQAEVLDQL
jgi:hypothetical protein